MNKFYYEFETDAESSLIKIKNLPDNVKILSAPRDKKEEKYYSYTLHYSDINHAILYLEKALQVEAPIEKDALFEAAIIRYMKCFTSSKSGRKQLNPNKVFSNVPGEPLGCHAKFKEIRDSYIAHDQNDFLDVRMGLVLQNNELKGVVCPPVQATFLYEENIEILLAMCRITYCFIVNILDEEVNKIHQKYENEWDIEAIRLLPEMELAL
ncbi:MULTISPECIES: hypothetical protein [Lachnospiraceae]|uniref:hypothetical protein n=1 Tax=Lachnospiraceae TaxID=186803 RepID=UPI0008E6C6E4|nr:MULTISPECIES: hypothetical protein [Lachnospiraceae]SFS23431.1 hypothetical protein SAMN05216568_11463 [Enterocloster citroniae]